MMVNQPRVSINTDLSDGLCFGCGENNPIGLKLSFSWDGRTARAEFTPDRLYQGWSGVVHGGILSCLLDEVMSHAATFKGLHCLTTRMEVRFKRPARVAEPLVVTATITEQNKRMLETEGKVTLTDGTLVAEGNATWFIIETSASQKGEPRDNAGK
ncbi:hypothetical protein ES703_41047 [subsurface metagenome]